MKRHLLVSCLILLLGAFVLAGCSQEKPSISTTNAQPSGIKIKGTVYTNELSGARGDVLSGAFVYLSGAATTSATATNSLGEYSFVNVTDGDYTIVASAEGHQRVSTTTVLIKSDLVDVTDNCVEVDDIVLDSSPVILSYSPTPNTEISRNPTFVVTFNETMDAFSVLPKLTITGIRASVSDNGSIPLAASWNASKTVLTLTTQATLPANTTCTLEVDSTSTAVDTAGYSLVAGQAGANELGQSLKADYSIDVGGLPGAPSNLSISTLNNKIITSDASGADFADAITGTNNVQLYWKQSTGEVSGYKVYVNDVSTNNYRYLTNTIACNPTVTLNQIMNALYGNVMASFDPLYTGKIPFVNNPLYVKVVAYNGDGESVSSEAAVSELNPPNVATGLASNFDAANPKGRTILTNGYDLPAITGSDTGVAYIVFNEPLNAASVTTSNITLEGSPGALVFSVLTQSSSDLGAAAADDFSIVRISSSDNITGKKVYIKGVTDLAGNSVAAGEQLTLN
ncbi:hypothetical protein A2230_02315 [candidate division WOR-1 bacterium RIFOXYA2_FULL_36_21]|uniref:SbsA Ig-like domain-containing protein n=1 Tax=candidate division WOR-1 bacterium RIFOXYB2_FULL_36_35 TaxID=1802578 RepID=A0A1F4S5V8_UNCSA|nr:MAG: hypothetical protein A2230_02315 [candidate division WOR-1 bacterium RIFOXYA2_FULL_36_21]OGC15814.1 MAG: hypothetical protein A2290_05710 [candidate division WOR-1 bacterium RIFOXYB2_FULL_36_35]OGC15924.1 MAG: hypothetical protein A2282_05000 [candidate division WOR-1 bacterium RIFOXYA12_FULL_36_13]